MATTALAELVTELSIKSGLSKTEIRRWVMALQKSHPSHPTVEKAASMIASVFGISKESSESAIRSQQPLDAFLNPEELRNRKSRETNFRFTIKDPKSGSSPSPSLVNIAEEELQKLTRFLTYLEEMVHKQS